MKNKAVFNGKRNIIINCSGCAMNFELQVALKLAGKCQNVFLNYHIWFARLLLKAPATAWAIFISLIIFMRL